MARECGMLSPPETGELCSTASAEEAHALPPCPLEAPPARSQSPPACPDLLRCGGAGRGIAGLLGPGRIQYEYRGHTVFNEPQALQSALPPLSLPSANPNFNPNPDAYPNPDDAYPNANFNPTPGAHPDSGTYPDTAAYPQSNTVTR